MWLRNYRACATQYPESSDQGLDAVSNHQQSTISNETLQRKDCNSQFTEESSTEKTLPGIESKENRDTNLQEAGDSSGC